MFPTVRFAARLDLILYLDGSSRLSCDIPSRPKRYGRHHGAVKTSFQ
jgi:hypothetical protein